MGKRIHQQSLFSQHKKMIIFMFVSMLLAGVDVLIVRYPQDVFFYQKMGLMFYEVHEEKKVQEETPPPMSARRIVTVPILIYHSIRPHIPHESREQEEYDVTPELFDQQLAYLTSHEYSFVTFDMLAAAINATGTATSSLPQKPIILSFDDGWHNQYQYAFPLLKKYRAQATFFVYTHAVGHRHYLSWNDIKELDAAGMSIEAHSITHPYLFKITNPTELVHEIAGSKQALEEHLGKPVNTIAYPFGRYNDQIVDIVKRSGYTSARSTYKGTRHSKDDLYSLRAFLVGDSFADFEQYVSVWP